MQYGITQEGRQRRFRGDEPIQHIARERDIENNRNRVGLFIRGLCGVVLAELFSHRFPMVDCTRCANAKEDI